MKHKSCLLMSHHVPTKTSNCKIYLQGRCRHGRLEKTADMFIPPAPPMCHKFTKNGERSCNKGSDCKYVHPKLCVRSLNTKVCLKVTCSFLSFWHQKKQRRPADSTKTDVHQYRQIIHNTSKSTCMVAAYQRELYVFYV